MADDGNASDAIEKENERRRKRREARAKKILADPSRRLKRITKAHSGGALSPPAADPPDLDLPLPTCDTTRSRSESLSGTNEFASSLPREPFQTHGESSRSHTIPTLTTEQAPDPCPTFSRTPSNCFTDEPDSIDRDDYFQMMLENLRNRNSSTGSLVSSYAGSIAGDLQCGIGVGGSSSVYDAIPEESGDNSQQQQQQQQVEELPQFPFPPDLMMPVTAPVDTRTREWRLLHFVCVGILGWFAVMSENQEGKWSRYSLLRHTSPTKIDVLNQVSNWSLFWYFVTLELILQSARLFLQKDKEFQGMVIGKLAAQLPAPFSDILKILFRYHLIWSSLWEDLCVLVFLTGLAVTFAPLFSFW